ncbi:glycoside hydrolase family 43 protein [Sinorhizobium meliloti]|uniref:Glycoside hydrolase 43 family protein n=1 Tax=Rhizobium meliloti TaxID=382 RepID=A0A2J0YXH6_RHIML|nr:MULTISPECIES: glycoside hydrolase family 43 protein [Sinorhizobium]PJR12958.1 glycoside hydrolase 43 family protein [Sinorhizobium meliloti]WEJ08956.1 glycoside hydrolase family 43 protein [Sinorhizobium sp. M103]WEJ35915.1 glycoside hydrolase family 43 protein [Sinorhizobium sp. C101]WRQ66351.1 glycoside hydrolase family 43 protein [Sinorhizobium meliloti]
MNATIRNPILPGFNPDPSICRVGEDYYIATSTFEWYPGVQIHHSRDLVNWRLVRRPLERASQLDMRGNPDSCGVWAPCLSYCDGLFWLVYTDVKRLDGNFKDAHNYIVTAEAVEATWSDPVYVNSSGFDPSLFHDDDGRKWFLNMKWNHRSESFGGSPKSPAFDGILLQEWDERTRKLVGLAKNIFAGSPLGLVEGPHLFKRDGWYYLTVAEGGTGYDHAVGMARSRTIDGPYEMHPNVHLITSKGHPEAALQRAGHGQYVETPDGQAYHTHLCGRPLPPQRRCTLGRETALQKCVWREDGWLYLENGGPVPEVTVPAPGAAGTVAERVLFETDFDEQVLPPEFQWLRTPVPERIFSLTARTGHLRLFGRESIGSWFEQALVARRQEHHSFRAEAVVDFAPDTYQQVAGLTHYYNRHKFHALGVTRHETLGRTLTVLSCPGDFPNGRLTYPVGSGIAVPDGPIHLAMEVRDNDLQFFWRGADQAQWLTIGPVLDAGVISDEGGRGEHGSFTGAFAGIFAFDISGCAMPADFDRFRYQALSV